MIKKTNNKDKNELMNYILQLANFILIVNDINNNNNNNNNDGNFPFHFRECGYTSKIL